jgi:hypothetical protein
VVAKIWQLTRWEVLFWIVITGPVKFFYDVREKSPYVNQESYLKPIFRKYCMMI